jgi:hypothetical protein
MGFLIPLARTLNFYFLLFQYLPVVLSMGIDALLPKVTELEMETYESILKKPGDKREGQLLANYDRVFKMLKDCALKYEIPLPLLFQQDTIPRTSLTYFNTNREVGSFTFIQGKICTSLCETAL